ncbi:MAG: hypothetical protein ABH871_07255 [Pseudomonadota bacterium]
MIDELRKRIPGEEFDYQALLDALKEYARPRDKITSLLKSRSVVRVKKGLYVFGENYARRPFSREILANMIYGPSYISLEYALSYYDMIPERAEAVTSVTCKRTRRFSTPIGLFLYRTVPLAAFWIGVDRVDIDTDRGFLIAVLEKALADKIQDDRGTGIRTQTEMLQYLIESLRIDESMLHQLNAEMLSQIAKAYRSRKILLLSNLIRRFKRSAKEVSHA